MNNKDYAITIKRIDLCDLLIACTVCGEASGAEKWEALHDKLEALLLTLDANNRD